jgi:hypothetical protein
LLGALRRCGFIRRCRAPPAVARADIKAQAAQKWVDAVSADGAYGRWAYALAKKPSEVKQLIAEVAVNSQRTISLPGGNLSTAKTSSA